MSDKNGILVGIFDEHDLKVGNDKKAVAAAKAQHGLKYTNTKLIKKNGVTAGLKIWVCDADTFKI